MTTVGLQSVKPRRLQTRSSGDAERTRSVGTTWASRSELASSSDSCARSRNRFGRRPDNRAPPEGRGLALRPARTGKSSCRSEARLYKAVGSAHGGQIWTGVGVPRTQGETSGTGGGG